MKKVFLAPVATIILAVTFSLIACSDEGQKVPTVDMSAIAQSDRPFTTNAAKLLFAACPGLTKYSPDIEWVKATIIESDLYDVSEKYGWTRWVNFEAKVAGTATAKVIPSKWKAWGHHLFYYVGPGGIDVQKGTAGYFCGLGHNTGFIDVN